MVKLTPKLAVVFIIISLLSACEKSAENPTEIPDDFKLYKAGDAFQFYGPPNLKYEQGKGVDSFVGYFTNADYSLQFDSGYYSSDLSEWNGIKTEHTIGGKKAYIIKSDFGIGVNFPLIEEGQIMNTRLTFSSHCDKKHFTEIEKLFNTISFPE